MAMEAQEQHSGDRPTAPSVSQDKWIQHALAKLARGYVLIVGTHRRTANFFLPNKGYEMCSYRVARQLIREGSVAKTRDHHLGEVYEIVAHARQGE